MATEKKAEKVEKMEKAAPQMVQIMLFKDSDKYKDDVFVAVNGKSFQIQRGVPVEVPNYVAEVLNSSMKQDMATADLIRQHSEDYAAEVKARGL